MKDRIPVIFCTDGLFPHAVGGIQRHSTLLIRTLAALGELDIKVIHPHEEQVFESELGIEEIRVDPLPGKQNYLVELYNYSKQVFDVLEKYPDHLVYAQGLTVWHQSSKLSSRLIVNPHGLEPYQPLTFSDNLKGFPYRVIFNRIFADSRKVISLGGSLTDILTKNISKAEEVLAVIPNAVNLPENREASMGKWNHRPPTKCLFVGRWAYNKGIDTLLETIDLIEEEGRASEFEFVLAGKGPLWESLSSEGERKGVSFPGFVDDDQLMNFYQQSHVFVLPTRFEGMPTVVLEAMAYGAGVLVTDVGATRELVNEENGEIIPKNDPHALKEALYRLAAYDADRWEQVYQASQKRVEDHFTWEAVAHKHVQLFNQIWPVLN